MAVVRAMLSYQHLYHAGNLADVQKHALLAWMLDYLTRKGKPLSYIETHAGRGLYDLGADEAVKTGEAAAGIARTEARFPPDHPYRRRLAEVRARFGPMAYPGSPLIAALSLRDGDPVHLAELHPQEYRALTENLGPWGAHIHQRARKWNVGIVALWYPLLTDAPHSPMLADLQGQFPDALRAEIRFPPARDGHRMVGSGLFVVNPPYGLAAEAARVAALLTAR